MQEEGPNEAGDDAASESQGLSEEDESRINATEGVNDGCDGGMGSPVRQVEAHKPQPQPQRQPQHQHWQQQQQVLQPPPPPPPPCPVVHWERFLPVRSLKVLLVENDDSTRQVVSALLRNCSYEVTAVTNGLEAWKVLEDLTNHVDIVLTEVVMPCLSGLGLLGKIMNHKTCKNIPVIMTSSHDSMGIVFKCLSKGAVDFLVKPIRKNELKNLWQHVWRRCHSSSSSGSESGIQTQKSVKSKSVEDSDNNTGSNDEDDNASVGLNMRDGSDNGSGTQSSWTKHVAEPDSPRPLSPWNQLAEAPDSTCAQVIHPKPEPFCNDWVPQTCSENQEQKEQPGMVETYYSRSRLLIIANCLEKDLEIGIPKNPDIQPESYPREIVSTNLSSSKIDSTQRKSHQSDDIMRGVDGSNANCELTTQAADLIGTITTCSMVTASAQASNSLHKITKDKEKATDTKELPSLELSLKRLRSIGGRGITSNDDRYVLRRSDQSAFSRYGASAGSSQKPTVYGGSSVPFDNGSDAVKVESNYSVQSKQNTTPLNRSNGSCNTSGMGSTTNNALTRPAAFNENISSAPTAKASSAFHPMKQQNYTTQFVVPENADNMASTKIVEEPRATQVQVQHHHHHYHHHHHHVHAGQQPLQQVQPPSDHDELSLKNIAAAAPPCGSSNMFNGPMEANVGKYSVNGSVSGSNHGSNGQNGSSAIHPGGTNMESENGLVGKNEAGGCNGSGSGSGGDQNWSLQRVAALTKFRQKRKQRCFQKKVRYQSRKQLAEQRPRVRGQFVRQIIRECASHEEDLLGPVRDH